MKTKKIRKKIQELGKSFWIMILVLFATSSSQGNVSKMLADLKMLEHVLGEGIIQGILAQEMCNCVYVMAPGQNRLTAEQQLEVCINKANLPVDRETLDEFVKVTTDDRRRGVSGVMTGKARFVSAGIGPDHFAQFDSESGVCRLL